MVTEVWNSFLKHLGVRGSRGKGDMLRGGVPPRGESRERKASVPRAGTPRWAADSWLSRAGPGLAGLGAITLFSGIGSVSAGQDAASEADQLRATLRL